MQLNSTTHIKRKTNNNNNKGTYGIKINVWIADSDPEQGLLISAH